MKISLVIFLCYFDKLDYSSSGFLTVFIFAVAVLSWAEIEMLTINRWKVKRNNQIIGFKFWGYLLSSDQDTTNVWLLSNSVNKNSLESGCTWMYSLFVFINGRYVDMCFVWWFFLVIIFSHSILRVTIVAEFLEEEITYLVKSLKYENMKISFEVKYSFWGNISYVKLMLCLNWNSRGL